MTCILSRLSEVAVISDKVLLIGDNKKTSFAHNKVVCNSPYYVNIRQDRVRFVRFNLDETAQFLKDLVDISETVIGVNALKFVANVQNFIPPKLKSDLTLSANFGVNIPRPEPLTHININDNI